jgi:hypothetical protein
MARVISDPDIWRAVQLVIKRHGDDAPLAAAQRADELFNENDLDGAAVWRRILHAIEELQRVRPKGGREGELVHLSWLVEMCLK